MSLKLLPINEGPLDRGLRIVLGVVLLALTAQSPWGYLGLIPLATGLIGSCPLYTVFGLSTCPVRQGPV